LRLALAWLLAAGVAVPAFAQSSEPAPLATPDPAQTVALARSVVGAPRKQPLSGTALDAEAKRIALLLRCPVCQGLSAEESPSGMAQNMRAQVREMVAAGYDEDQILRYFERSYGEFVRLEPPLRGVNWIVWLAPLAALAAGGVIVGLMLRRPRPAAAAAGSPAAAEAAPAPDQALPDDTRLADYVLRVRERAYGWPGGVRPGSGTD